MPAPIQERTGHRLLQLGLFLFLLGLLVGFGVPRLANPRIGLASHVEGLMNGLFLVAVCLLLRAGLRGTSRQEAA